MMLCKIEVLKKNSINRRFQRKHIFLNYFPKLLIIHPSHHNIVASCWPTIMSTSFSNFFFLEICKYSTDPSHHRLLLTAHHYINDLHDLSSKQATKQNRIVSGWPWLMKIVPPWFGFGNGRNKNYIMNDERILVAREEKI